MLQNRVCYSVRIEKRFTRAVQPAKGHITGVLLSAPEDIIDTQLVYMTPLLDTLPHVLSNNEFITLFTAQCMMSLGSKRLINAWLMRSGPVFSILYEDGDTADGKSKQHFLAKCVRQNWTSDWPKLGYGLEKDTVYLDKETVRNSDFRKAKTGCYSADPEFSAYFYENGMNVESQGTSLQERNQRTRISVYLRTDITMTFCSMSPDTFGVLPIFFDKPRAGAKHLASPRPSVCSEWLDAMFKSGLVSKGRTAARKPHRHRSA
ncbi:hypothetical protein EV421DRAFT_78160 [Armillaria borealis]|uniref:Uncharacterized protein n=1 Tax=Armillaria borealis TaxID=47425 RepID=A0AA39KD87_9AGAR|nr:hypothetical protein EV421DRAFT_78160 [Armillaria borealis]